MLVPIIGPGWTLVVDVVVVVASLAAVVWLCYWFDGPRRDLIAEIKRRPRIVMRID